MTKLVVKEGLEFKNLVSYSPKYGMDNKCRAPNK